MGLHEEELFVAKRRQQIESTENSCISCLWSFLVSMTGGLLLGYWEYEYHSTYSQLWMVPFGLILLVTPVIAWLAVYVSEICMCGEEDGSRVDWPVRSVGDSVPDLEK